VDRSVPLEVTAEIRRATLRDLPALATWSGQVDEVFRPAVESQDKVLLVAVANGRFPIGHALVDLRGIISNLLVLGGFRDQGLGSVLIAQAEELMRGAGRLRSSLVVEKANVDAIRLYVRLGYSTTGDTVETWPEPMPDGTVRPVDHPAWVMQKEL
jgi:ribosomal protein S18 acetylase RimI-like enzyme